MEELLAPDKFSLLLQLVVPGFVIAYVRNQMVANRRLPISDAVVGYIALSFVYQALVFPLATWLRSSPLTAEGKGLVELLISIVLPAAVGLLIGLNARLGWSRRLLARFRVSLNHPVNTAWDWRFGGKEECWVMAVLKDGTKWLGHLGPDSFISTDPGERDIYIQTVYSIEDDNSWKFKGSGVWLPQSELQSLEFWALTKAALSAPEPRAKEVESAEG
jgi:hypothetical protein